MKIIMTIKYMTYIKKTVWTVVGIILLVCVIYLGLGVVDFISFKTIAKSAGGMPWQDGGKITKVRKPCVLDTPEIDPIACSYCPLVTKDWGSACAGFIELDTQSQMGTINIDAPIGFVYGGGGTMPAAGMSYIAGGVSGAIPWVIGIPSSPGAKIQKIIDWFDYGIASFKNKIK